MCQNAHWKEPQCKENVDAWVDVLSKTDKGEDMLEDRYIGKINMKTVDDKKYLGQIVSKDLKNDKNITDIINKLFGNVNKIVTTLNERPFGS